MKNNGDGNVVTKEFLDMTETAKLEEAAVYLRDQVLIRILRRLGCRVSEALGIELKHIDFENKIITIEHEKTHIKRQCPQCNERVGKRFNLCPYCGADVKEAVALSHKEKEYRNLPVDQNTLDLIKEYLDRGGAKKVGDKTMLFNITRQYAWKIVKDCAIRAGLPEIINVKKQKVHHVSPHKLRDSFATIIANKDSSMESLKRLQDHLGHKNINTTMGYVRTTGEQSREWYEKNLKDENLQETEEEKPHNAEIQRA